MSIRVLLACVAALALSSEARAITFLTTQFDVTAIATADGAPPGIDTDSGPPSPTPVSASADSVAAVNIATAGAIGGPGLLTASADASSGGGIANAVSTAHFAGTFVMSAAEPLLYVTFDPLTFASGSGLGSASLFVALSLVGGAEIFGDFVTGPWEYGLMPGTTYLLDLTLTSEASAGFPAPTFGNASSIGLTTFTSAVPLPAPWLLLLAGLAPVAAMKKRAVEAVGSGLTHLSPRAAPARAIQPRRSVTVPDASHSTQLTRS